ncbi:TRAFs-binding domain-containing protein [Nocardia sp. NPDC057455]|uniref:TRAFs-binding domain-containing protein n=1 Tax=Nocardia sp. NPDC057455 TaxID=3346138 RepID=UPI00366C6667
MTRPLCFVVMPFGTKSDTGMTVQFDKVYEQIIHAAVEQSGMTCLRADEEQFGGSIHRTMFERLMLCDYAVADLTMANANVYYELGIRHAIRPWSTVLVSAADFRLPFNIAQARVARYAVDAHGEPTRPEHDRADLGWMLAHARQHQQVDSPLFDLFRRLRAPDVTVLDTKAFKERVERTERLQALLKSASSPRDVAAVEAELGVLDGLDDGVLIDLLLAHRRFRQWQRMIDLVERMPAHIRDNPVVREQRAVARNRLRPGSPLAQRELEKLRDEHGPNGETLGILGRVFKDRWLAERASGRADGLLRKALDAYLAGFEADWTNPYPGINAVHLLWLTDRADPRLAQLLPVVEFATRMRIKWGSTDYWDHATMIEVATYRGDMQAAVRALDDALATGPGPMEAESTLETILRVRAASDSDSEEWDILEKALRRASCPHE